MPSSRIPPSERVKFSRNILCPNATFAYCQTAGACPQFRPRHERRHSNRRQFIKAGSTAVVAASTLSFPTVTFGKPDSRKLKIGFIGCGGRGTGAAAQALTADSNVELWSMGEYSAIGWTVRWLISAKVARAKSMSMTSGSLSDWTPISRCSIAAWMS